MEYKTSGSGMWGQQHGKKLYKADVVIAAVVTALVAVVVVVVVAAAAAAAGDKLLCSLSPFVIGYKKEELVSYYLHCW
jgi:hypothetical protein